MPCRAEGPCDLSIVARKADKCDNVDPPIVTYSSEALPMSPVRLRPGDRVHRACASCDCSASASGRVHHANASRDRSASAIAPAIAVLAAPAPVEEIIAPVPAVFAAPAAVNEYIAPAPAVIAAPAPTIRTKLLRSLAELAPHLSQIISSARRQPLQPPARNGKGRGVLSAQRHGVEQQSLAYTVSPRRALPLPLSDVG